MHDILINENFICEGIIISFRAKQVQSSNAVMQHVEESTWEYLRSETKMLSHERLLQRFVSDLHIKVDECWKQFLSQVLTFWHHKPITLILEPVCMTRIAPCWQIAVSVTCG